MQMRMDFTLEATGSFTFGTDIQLCKNTTLHTDYGMLPLETIHVLHDQGKQAMQTDGLLTQVLGSPGVIMFPKATCFFFFGEEKKQINLWGFIYMYLQQKSNTT